MYSIRINPDSACKPKLRAPGCVWVKQASSFYVQESDRTIFKTIKDAQKEKGEHWEMVVKVEVEK